jgi:6,7-dimethyl-8-ribityllumazine synthase
MPKIIEGKLNGEGLKIGMIVSRFNDFITKRLEEGCLDCLVRHGVKDQNIQIVRVPGSMEIPLIAQSLAKSKKLDAVVALGAIIRGETPHFDYVASECAKGITKITLDTGVPVLFGVVTADNLEQAIERAGTKAGNKGWQAALAALEMAQVIKELK